MSANSANPVEKVEDTDAPIQDKGVDYERYAADDSSKKTANSEMVFDSAEIDKREKTEYFVNVEGAEKRKREEERRQAEEQRRRFNELKRHDEKLKNEAAAKTKEQHDFEEQQKKLARAEKKRTRQDKKKANFARLTKKLFGGKKKFIWLAAILIPAIIFGTIYVQKNVIEPAAEARADEEFDKYAQDDRAKVSEVEAVVGEMIMTKESDDEIIKYIKTELDKLDKGSDEYVMLAIYYGDMLGRRKDYNEGISFLKSIEPSVKKDYEKERLYLAYYIAYSMTKDFENGNKYANLVNSMKRRSVVKDLEKSEDYYEENHK